MGWGRGEDEVCRGSEEKGLGVEEMEAGNPGVEVTNGSQKCGRQRK